MTALIDTVLGRLNQGEIEYFQGRRCLVTGGAGFIGGWLVEALVKLGAEVRVADNLWRGSLKNLERGDGKYWIDLDRQFFQVDLREYHECLSTCLDTDMVFHLADIVAGVDYVFANEPSLFRSNMLINTNVFTAASKLGVDRLIYVGAACSYPKELQAVPGREPLVEEQVYPANPESAYGWSKLMGEYEADLIGKNSPTRVGILRFHNVYGPRSDISIKRSQVIPSLIRKAIKYPDEKFTVWGSGKQTRSFIFIADIIDALLRESLHGFGEGPIQIGTAEQTTIADLARMIVKISGKPIGIHFDTSKPEGDGGRSANCAKAERILGWRPFTPVQDGLEMTYRWAYDQIQNEGVSDIDHFVDAALL